MSQPPTYGPLSTRPTELVWEGKYGNRREVDIAGCARREAAATGQWSLFEQQNPKQDDFRNWQVRKTNQWGDSKLVMAHLSSLGVKVLYFLLLPGISLRPARRSDQTR